MPPPVAEDQILRVYRETIDPLYAFISRRCGGERALAEDTVQEVWLRAVREWRMTGVPERPLAWLSAVGRNLLLNELRRRRPISLEVVDPDQLLAAVQSDDANQSAESAAILTLALARLPARQSWLLEMFHLEHWRISRIAEALGISERAVEGRLRRAREHLRRELEQPTRDTGVLI